jgi:plasmid stabilization system protein ParE
MTFRVETTAQAERDAESILEWLLSQHAGEAGTRWFQALESAIASLTEFPKRCALAPEDRVFPFEVRQLLYGHKPHIYRILFTIQDETVYVLHIRHGRRQPVKS